MTDDPNWADIMSAVGTCVTGAAAAYLGWQANSLEKKRHHHELSPDRRQLYNKINDLKEKAYKRMELAGTDLGERLSDADMDAFLEIKMQAPSLFGPSVIQKLNEMHSNLFAAHVRNPKTENGKELARKIWIDILETQRRMRMEFDSPPGTITTILTYPLLWVYILYQWLQRRFRRSNSSTEM